MQPLFLGVALSVALVGCVTDSDPDESGRFGGKKDHGPTEEPGGEIGETGATSGGSTEGAGGTAGEGGSTSGPSGSGPAGTGGGAGTNSCTSHSACAEHEYCDAAAACVPAWGKTFRITIVEATIIPTKPNSTDAWDINNGAPDPFVIAYIGEDVHAMSSTIDDTFEPQWNEAVEIVFQHGAPDIALVMVDADIAAHDFIGGTVHSPQGWLDLMKDYGTVQITDANGNVMVIDVAPAP